MGLLFPLLLSELRVMKVVSIVVDVYLCAPSGIAGDGLDIVEDVSVMGLVRAVPAFRLGMKTLKFERHLAGIDSQNEVHEIACRLSVILLDIGVYRKGKSTSCQSPA